MADQRFEPDEKVATNVNLLGRHRNWAVRENKNLSAVLRDALDAEMGCDDD